MKVRGGYHELETVVVEASTCIFGADWDLWWGSSWNCCSYRTSEHDGDEGMEHGKSHLTRTSAAQDSTLWLSAQGPEAHFLQRHSDQIFLQRPLPQLPKYKLFGISSDPAGCVLVSFTEFSHLSPFDMLELLLSMFLALLSHRL